MIAAYIGTALIISFTFIIVRVAFLALEVMDNE